MREVEEEEVKGVKEKKEKKDMGNVEEGGVRRR